MFAKPRMSSGRSACARSREPARHPRVGDRLQPFAFDRRDALVPDRRPCRCRLPVAQITSDSTRSGYAAAKRCPTMPPIDRPTKRTRADRQRVEQRHRVVRERGDRHRGRRRRTAPCRSARGRACRSAARGASARARAPAHPTCGSSCPASSRAPRRARPASRPARTATTQIGGATNGMRLPRPASARLRCARASRASRSAVLAVARADRVEHAVVLVGGGAQAADLGSAAACTRLGPTCAPAA